MPRLSRLVLATIVALTLVACDRSTGPRPATGRAAIVLPPTPDSGTFDGHVLRIAPTNPPGCWGLNGPTHGALVPGMLVEVGHWNAPVPAYRDSLASGDGGAKPDDPRFIVIARGHSDALGHFRIGGLPRGGVYGLRVRPERGSRLGVAYSRSLYGFNHVREIHVWLCPEELGRSR